MADTPMTSNSWQNILDQLNSKGNSLFYFPKAGKTRLRLLWPTGHDESDQVFFVETLRYFKGQVRTRFIVMGQVLTNATGEVDEKFRNQVKAIVINKTTLRSILTALAEGYDLLGPEGHGLTLVRTGEGLETDYNVLTSPRPVKVDYEELEWPEESIEDLAEMFAKESKDRDTNRPAEGTDDKLKKARKAQEATGDEW
jgi:hypothetical protein